jgi:hypothetical protein
MSNPALAIVSGHGKVRAYTDRRSADSVPWMLLSGPASAIQELRYWKKIPIQETDVVPHSAFAIDLQNHRIAYCGDAGDLENAVSRAVFRMLLQIFWPDWRFRELVFGEDELLRFLRLPYSPDIAPIPPSLPIPESHVIPVHNADNGMSAIAFTRDGRTHTLFYHRCDADYLLFRGPQILDDLRDIPTKPVSHLPYLNGGFRIDSFRRRLTIWGYNYGLSLHRVRAARQLWPHWSFRVSYGGYFQFLKDSQKKLPVEMTPDLIRTLLPFNFLDFLDDPEFAKRVIEYHRAKANHIEPESNLATLDPSRFAEVVLENCAHRFSHFRAGYS